MAEQASGGPVADGTVNVPTDVAAMRSEFWAAAPNVEMPREVGDRRRRPTLSQVRSTLPVPQRRRDRLARCQFAARGEHVTAEEGAGVSAPDVQTPGGNLANAEEQTQSDAAIVADVTRTDKVETTLIATAALAGFDLRRLEGGRWRVSRWNLTRELADAGAVRAFLASAGVRA